MKELKKQVEKEDRKLLEETDFLEQTLYKEVDKNKGVKRRKIMWYAVPFSLGCLIFIVAVGVNALHRFNEKTYESKSSELGYLNSTLKNTRLTGEFGSILFTYESRHKTPAYFTVKHSHEDVEVRYREVSITVVIDREYELVSWEGYLKKTEIMGYTVYYNAKEVADTSSEPTIYGFEINAFLDTGAERFVIDYTEYNFTGSYAFAEYLQETIKQK